MHIFEDNSETKNTNSRIKLGKLVKDNIHFKESFSLHDGLTCVPLENRQHTKEVLEF